MANTLDKFTDSMKGVLPFTLPELPYSKEALEPVISAKTLGFHYDKHHAGYVTKLNELTAGGEFEGKGLEYVITESAKKNEVAIFNNAAQVWNHTFYWYCMISNGGGIPKGRLLDEITKAFQSFDNFKKEFKAAAIGQFGSGWVWLVLDKGQLQIMKTGNADLPMNHGAKALLTVDVWEHAYYLDYQNRRADYIDVFLERLVNWQFVEENLSS